MAMRNSPSGLIKAVKSVTIYGYLRYSPALFSGSAPFLFGYILKNPWLFSLPGNRIIPYDVTLLHFLTQKNILIMFVWIHKCMWNLLAMKTSPLLFLIKFIFKYVILVRLIFELGTAPPRNTINLSARTGTLNLTGLVSQTNGSARKQRLKEVSRLLREVLNLMAYKRRRRPKVVPFSACSRP